MYIYDLYCLNHTHTHTHTHTYIYIYMVFITLPGWSLCVPSALTLKGLRSDRRLGLWFHAPLRTDRYLYTMLNKNPSV